MDDYKQHVPADHETVGLLDLAEGLWRSKWLVGGIAAACTIAGIAYALLAMPIYESRMYAVPPSINDIAEFNYGRTNQAELKPYTVKDIYDVYLARLQSDALRRQVYERSYLPSFTKDQGAAKPVIYNEFIRLLTVTQPSKDTPDRYLIIMQDPDPERAKQVVHDYLAQVDNTARAEMITSVVSEAQVRARNLGHQIETLRKAARDVREDAIVQLEEALRVAQSVGLQTPPIIGSGMSTEISANMTQSLMYMRGSKALEAEIRNLKGRASDDAFIEQLRPLQIRYDYFSNIAVDPASVAMVHYDGGIVVSDLPVKPRKALIVIASAIGGVLLGIGAGLTAMVWRRRRSTL